MDQRSVVFVSEPVGSIHLLGFLIDFVELETDTHNGILFGTGAVFHRGCDDHRTVRQAFQAGIAAVKIRRGLV